MAEREAAAGLYSLLNANAGEQDGRTPDPQAGAPTQEQLVEPEQNGGGDPHSFISGAPLVPPGLPGVLVHAPPGFSSTSVVINPTSTAAAASTSTSPTPSTSAAADPNPKEAFLEIENSIESMHKLTESLLQNRPVVDPRKNQGFGIVTPHENDILSGRGNGANQHPGNIFFRSLIYKYKYHYIHTGPSEKKLISKRIVEEVQQRNPPGRFLKQNQVTELWDCLDIDKVLKKTGQALREKAPELKKRAREEYKQKVNSSSHESYFQNTNAGSAAAAAKNNNNIAGIPTTLQQEIMLETKAAAAAAHAPGGGEPHLPALGSSKNAMAFPIQPNTLDQIAYQNIPLASQSNVSTTAAGGGTVVRDSFNMTHLAAVTNQVVDPANKEKIEELISNAVDPNVLLADVYNFVKLNHKALFTTKPKIVHTQQYQQYYPMQISRTAATASTQIPQVKGGIVIAPSATIPHAHDVLFRNGDIVPSHPGSKFFCDQVNLLLPQYQGSIINEKRIEQKVISSIGARWPPGRFLCASDHTCTTWHVLSFAQALKATSNHLRHAFYESKRVIVPNLHDVLLVRGNRQHKGNIYFRSLVEKLYPKREQDTSQNAKKRIAKQILDDIDRVGGRFLKYDEKQNKWERLDFETSMIKTIQALQDHQKKEVRLKYVKTVEVVVPALNCVKEDFRDGGKNNNDPPGIFYNYYSNNGNNDNDFLATEGNDPPGQVANVVPIGKVNGIAITKKLHSPGQQDHIMPQIEHLHGHVAPEGESEMGVPTFSPQLGYSVLSEQNPDPPCIGETRKREHEMDESNVMRQNNEKKQKLEP